MNFLCEAEYIGATNPGCAYSPDLVCRADLRINSNIHLHRSGSSERDSQRLGNSLDLNANYQMRPLPTATTLLIPGRRLKG